MASQKQQILNAIAKYGASVDHIAARYTNPVTGQKLTGRALLAKLLQGESSALSNPDSAKGQVSSAGAKAWGQFMPGSRQEAISKFGIDPWSTADEAVHATALHLRGKINGSTGLEGYNPGDPSYTSYILSQKVGHLAGDTLKPRGGAAGAAAGVGGAAGGATAAALASVTQSAPSGLTGVSPLAQALQLQARPTPVPSQGIAPPAFAAAPVIAAGYGQPVQTGAPAPPPSIQLPDLTQAELPGAATTTVQPGDGVGITTPTAAQGQSDVAAAGGRGTVVVGPGAERAGHGLQKPILGFLRDVSAVSGREVKVTTGTNHSQYVAGTNRVSDHWGGNATDLGLGGDARESKDVGKRGDLIAAHALQVAAQRAGDGMTFAAALKLAKRGGIFNYETPGGRVQIIWRAPGHYDHVHVGLNPGR